MSDLLVYLITGLGAGCGFALVGSGLVVVHRVTRVVNFAQGTFAVLAGLTASSLLGNGLPHGAAEILAIAVAAAAGLLVGLLAIGRPGTGPQSALVITLGASILAYAVEIVIWGDQTRSSSGISGAVTILGARVQSHYLLVIGAGLAVFAVMGAFFARTDLGKALTACASNPYAARVVGIDTTRMGLLSFAVGGALGGLAGVLLTPMQPVTFDSDVTLVVNGFAAAVLGGLTRIGLTLLGGLLLGVVQALVAGYGNAAYQLEVALLLMLALMVARAARTSSLLQEAS